MCGILGYVGTRDGRQVLHMGLSRLEYRGYDSAGVAMRTDAGLAVEKVVGRVEALPVDQLPEAPQGIGHTRWATHGAPSTANAHPHLSCDGRIAVVHNGIITNHLSLRRELEDRGHAFESETDTEVLAHLLEETYEEVGGDLVEAVARAQTVLEGSYALCAMHQDRPGQLVATRYESPLVLGIGERACFVASDVVAFLEHTKRVVYLHDGDVVSVTPEGHAIRSGSPGAGLDPVVRPVEEVPWDLEEATLAGFPHFMLKEMHEQPQALREALVGRSTLGELSVEGGLGLAEAARCTDVHFIACGSSHHAGLLVHQLFEEALQVPVASHLASEMSRTGPVVGKRPLFITISQSGETADTLGAVRAVRNLGHDVLAFTNTVGSTITREANGWLPLRAGPELSVAATKSFSSQVMALALLAAHLGHLRGRSSGARLLMEGLRHAPHDVQEVLDQPEPFEAAGRSLEGATSAFVLGSGAMLPVAQETALKIKEISYVHAEAFATGELKHGPLALVEEGTPALVFALSGPGLAQSLSAMREVAARGGVVTAITDAPDVVEEAGFKALPITEAPWPAPLFSATVAGQLVAYHAAVVRGCDVDRPRNLAKSVTVE